MMAQSENTATWSLKHMRNAPETSFWPGLVLMTCRAGRTVLAVEFTEPETRPVGVAEHHDMGAEVAGVGQLLAGLLLGLPFLARTRQPWRPWFNTFSST